MKGDLLYVFAKDDETAAETGSFCPSNLKYRDGHSETRDRYHAGFAETVGAVGDPWCNLI
jgi:hypothetical protein